MSIGALLRVSEEIDERVLWTAALDLSAHCTIVLVNFTMLYVEEQVREFALYLSSIAPTTDCMHYGS